ncbi:MAG: FAD-binding oxidoreductase [Chitinophagaceae bacterium]|nr:FAD-binding oxidoreductase [Chitinophagaceae bacterium]
MPRYLIIGQGIAGTLLSYELWKQNISFLVYDEPKTLPKARGVAGAVINPVNVNKWTMAEDYEYFTAAAVEMYRDMEKVLDSSLLQEMDMLVFHKNEEDRQHFNAQQTLYPTHIHQPSATENNLARDFFRCPYELGKVSPVWKLQSKQLLQLWSVFLQQQGLLIREHFNWAECQPGTESVKYRKVDAEKVICCEGATAIHNPYLRHLPFTRNRGDALMIGAPDLPPTHIYQYGVRLVPAGDGLFWCGSNYRWQYDNLLPDEGWRRQTEATLRQWLKLPFSIESHLVAERPTTAGQQFFVGTISSVPSVAIFNGLGTKGFSCGPALAKELCTQLLLPGQKTSIPGIATI